MFREQSASRWLAVVVAAALGVAACGGSSHHAKSASKPKTTATHTTATAPSTTATTATTSGTGKYTSQVTSGPVHAKLIGENHAPIANHPWKYEVHVTSASGQPLSGTILTEFVYPPIGVVGKESPPTHKFTDGVFKDSVRFPPTAEGHTVYLQTVIHTKDGSVTLDWQVTTKP